MNWRLKIRHVTGYKYAGPVSASYNEARLTPLTLPWQTTLFSQVEVTPGATTYRYHDYWATQVTAFDLHRPHQQLRVVSSSLVEVTPPPAPAFFLGWANLDTDAVVDAHAEFLASSRLTAVAPELVEQVWSAAGSSDPTESAEAVSHWVREQVAYVPGSTGVQTSAQEAWDLRKGVCQDIAHLTVGLLRARGIPARYVSGYLHPKVEAEVGETVAGQSHAWVEWWAGEWTGFDPTNGVAVGPRHVVVARGRDYDDVPPLRGVYHGAPSKHLGVTVEITRLA
ncbi:transglutaminase domain-containing protein [Dactylosporangium sp. NPDC051541]|uniref:transglutaminase family protein n=1 Tax=Dactylosporangium sp. NPDC051541 TaxID=3363977 RepID=UPI0037884AD9